MPTREKLCVYAEQTKESSQEYPSIQEAQGNPFEASSTYCDERGVKSQILMVLSSLPLTMLFPSGLYATL
jgi:hypothetical protein